MPQPTRVVHRSRAFAALLLSFGTGLTLMASSVSAGSAGATAPAAERQTPALAPPSATDLGEFVDRTKPRPREGSIPSINPPALVAGPWRVITAQGVEMTATVEPGGGPKREDGTLEPAVRLDYHFKAGGGFAILQRTVPAGVTGAGDLPPNYAFSFWVKGQGPSQNLEFKLLDNGGNVRAGNDTAGGGAPGTSVWWVNRRAFEFPQNWTRLDNPKRRFEFAWGPAADAAGKGPAQLGAIEFAIASHSGGKGTVWISAPQFRQLPELKPWDGKVTITATSNADAAQKLATSEEQSTGWSPAVGDEKPSVTLDFGVVREIGGVVVMDNRVSRQTGPARSVEVSEDGQAWRTIGSVQGLEAAVDLPARLLVADGFARWVRVHAEQNIALPAVGGGGRGAEGALAQLTRVKVLSADEAKDETALLSSLARAMPRGALPRTLLGEQSYWTVVGVSGDNNEALINEDGMVELWRSGPSIEPFVVDRPSLSVPRPPAPEGTPQQAWQTELARRHGLLTWAEGATTADLLRVEGRPVPIPIVTRRQGDWELRIITTAIDGALKGTQPGFDAAPPGSTLIITYELFNRGQSPRTAQLTLGLRPVQVNAPWQFLNNVGGWARVSSVKVERVNDAVVGINVNGDRRVRFVGPFDGLTGPFGNFVDAALLEALHGGVRGAERDMSSSNGTGSAAWSRFSGRPIAPGRSIRMAVAVPMGPEANAPDWSAPADDQLDGLIQAQAKWWDERLSRVQFLTPAKVADHAAADPHAQLQRDLAETARMNLAYILINRDGPGIQPGSRSYERSWIRDGSMTSAALLELGLHEEATAFIDWFGPYVYPSGHVPCVVDTRGADPVNEHDSHGQYIWGVWNAYRYTGDRALLERHWPTVQRTVGYIRELRGQRMAGPFADRNSMATRQEPGKPPVLIAAFFGMMPESISHEGYSAKPMHSYWDNLFILRGLKDAANIARELGKPEDAGRIAELAEQFRRDLLDSFRASMRAHQINYLPGCVELGDFDSTSTTVALWPCQLTTTLAAEGPSGGAGANAAAAARDDADVHAALIATFEKYLQNFRARRDSDNWREYTPYELRHVGALVRLGWREQISELFAFYMPHQRPQGWRHWAEVVWRDPRAGRFIGDMPHTWVGSDFINSYVSMWMYERESDRSIVLFAGIPPAWLPWPAPPAPPGAAGANVGPPAAEPIGFRGLFVPSGRLDATIRRTGAKQVEVQITGQLRGPLPPGGIVITNPLSAGGAISKAVVNGQTVPVRGRGAAAEVTVREVPATVIIDTE